MSKDLILTTAVENLGGAGDMVTVKDGYARNYLLPQGRAILATAGNKKRLESLARKRADEEAAQLDSSKKLGEKLAQHTCTIYATAGQDGRLFGSVNAADIAAALKKAGLEIERKKIHLDRPLHELGTFDVEVKLHADVTTKLKVAVVAGDDAQLDAQLKSAAATEKPAPKSSKTGKSAKAETTTKAEKSSKPAKAAKKG